MFMDNDVRKVMPKSHGFLEKNGHHILTVFYINIFALYTGYIFA